MVIAKRMRPRRGGATAIETALVMIPVLMIIFGVFEYGLLLFNWNLLNNATREGCRYALANNTASTINTDVTNVVTGNLNGTTQNFTGFSVSLSGVDNGTTYTGANVTNLVAGDMITVSVSGTYHFINPVPLLRLPTSITLSSSVTMVCEGGM